MTGPEVLEVTFQGDATAALAAFAAAAADVEPRAAVLGSVHCHGCPWSLSLSGDSVAELDEAGTALALRHNVATGHPAMVWCQAR